MSKVKRSIIKIDDDKCNGCGLCIPNCPEGAMQIIDDKARLISDLFCDGLGACIGHCPQGAISIEERNADEYNERKVMENVAKQGKNVIKAHLEHLKAHGQTKYFQDAVDFLKEKNIKNPLEENASQKNAHFAGCPGAKMMDFTKSENIIKAEQAPGGVSQLRQWPIQIALIPPTAPYLNNSDLLIAADCVPFTYPNFHDDFLKGKILLIGCPKLDDINFYKEKFISILKNSNVKSLEVVHMEVPCCFGLKSLVEGSIAESGKDIRIKDTVISIKGKIM